jgi:hypothetical protein
MRDDDIQDIDDRVRPARARGHLAEENPIWGAPRIHGELQKLGFDLSERTVARYLQRVQRRGDPGKSWLTFLTNHREVIAAFDFFTVPTLSFQVLYCFFVIEHGRRKILHFNVTRHPTAEWVVQQLREAFPEVGPYRYCGVRCRSGRLPTWNRSESQEGASVLQPNLSSIVPLSSKSLATHLGSRS